MKEKINNFIMNFVSNALTSIISSIILALLSYACWRAFDYFRNKNKYSIKGYWISKYNSSFDNQNIVYDIVLIRFTKNKLLIKYLQYNKKIFPKCAVYTGEGYYGEGKIAVAYFLSEEKVYRNGVMLLNQVDINPKRKGFSGKCYEFYDIDNVLKGKTQTFLDSKTKIVHENYYLLPIKLSVKEKIKFKFGKNFFSSHDEIVKRYDKLFAEYRK